MTDLSVWIKIITGIVSLAVIFFTQVLPWLKKKRDQVSLEKRFGAELYSKGVIEQAIRFYIQPECKILTNNNISEQKNIFKFFDDALNQPIDYKYIFLLGDTGIGKTSFLLNYFIRNLRRSCRKRFNLYLLPLGLADRDDQIGAITNKNNIVLFLDGLDEDFLIDYVGYQNRIDQLIELTKEFKKVVITCRPKILSEDKKIPTETNVKKPLYPIKLDSTRYHNPCIVNILPFTDEQVKTYLKYRYPIWQIKRRQQVQKIANKLEALKYHPMILEYVDKLINMSNVTFEIYENIIQNLLKREKSSLKGNDLKSIQIFINQFTVFSYMQFGESGLDKLSNNQLKELATMWNSPMTNFDGLENYQLFMNPPLRDYVVIKEFWEKGGRSGLQWTKQMKKLFLEMLRIKFEQEQKLPERFYEVDLANIEGVNLAKLHQAQFSKAQKANKSVEELRDRGQAIIDSRYWHSKQEIKEGIMVKDDKTDLVYYQAISSEVNNISPDVYVQKLNAQKFAGYNDWRLPTLGEALCLIEYNEMCDLNNDSIFEKRKSWIVVRRFS